MPGGEFFIILLDPPFRILRAATLNEVGEVLLKVRPAVFHVLAGREVQDLASSFGASVDDKNLAHSVRLLQVLQARRLDEIESAASFLGKPRVATPLCEKALDDVPPRDGLPADLAGESGDEREEATISAAQSRPASARVRGGAR